MYSLPGGELFERLLLVLALAGDAGAEVEAGTGNDSWDDSCAGPNGCDGTVCAEIGLGRATDGDAEKRSGRHGESLIKKERAWW